MDTQKTKELRAEIQTIVDYIDNATTGSRETALAKTKLQEAKMWLGQHLGTIPGNVDLNAVRDKVEEYANDPFTSESTAGTQKEADQENVCTSCEG